MELTGHAVQRCSQRGIRKQQIEWLINFGCHTWNRGAKVYFFDRPHYQRLLLRLSAADRQLAEKTRNGIRFVIAAEAMIEANERVNNEFYVAPAYDRMIAQGAKVGIYNVGAEADGMYGLGIPSDLKLFMSLPVHRKALEACK